MREERKQRRQGAAEESLRVRTDKRRSENESKKMTKPDQTAVSPNTGNLAGDMAIIKNNRPEMLFSIHVNPRCSQCKYCISMSRRQTAKAKTKCCCFVAKNHSSCISLLW